MTTQPAPSGRVVALTGVIAVLLVGAPGAWSVTRHVVTIAHEAAHGFVAFLSGRRLQGIRLPLRHLRSDRVRRQDHGARDDPDRRRGLRRPWPARSGSGFASGPSPSRRPPVGIVDPVGVVADSGAQLVRTLVDPGQRNSSVRRVLVARTTDTVRLRLCAHVVPAPEPRPARSWSCRRIDVEQGQEAPTPTSWRDSPSCRRLSGSGSSLW